MKIKLKRKWLMAVLVSILGLLAVSCIPVPQTGGGDWDESADEIGTVLDQAVAAHREGDQERASKLAKDAYFEVFESSGMEAAIRLGISSQRAFEVEYQFAEVRKQIRNGATATVVKGEVDQLMSMVRKDANRLEERQGDGGTGTLASSFLILVREGLEAILIIGAIIAYLIKSGNKDKVKIIYQAGAVAIAASIATAVLIRWVFDVSGAKQEFLEGATMLLAVAVLFSVSFWLLSKVEAQKWQNYIRSKVESSLNAGNTLALWMVAFLAVYREGAETVLFYQALYSDSDEQGVGGLMGLGFLAGIVVLVAIFIAVRWASVRLPLKPFFLLTGLFLYYMAFVFAGEGVRELQEAGTIQTHLISGMSSVDWLGIYPTWEGVMLQGALFLAAGLAAAYQFLYKGRQSLKVKEAGM